MSKLFVYGVNAQCPRDILEGEFARCGEVTDVYITEKGYAFVTMADSDAADAAVKELNGAIIDGKEVKVDRARERGSGGGGRGGYGGGRGGGQFFIMSTEFDKNISDYTDHKNAFDFFMKLVKWPKIAIKKCQYLIFKVNFQLQKSSKSF